MAEDQATLADIPPIGLEDFNRLLKVRRRVVSELERDVNRAQRAERLSLLLAGKPVADVWAKDLAPMIEKLYDVAESNLVPGTPDKDTLIGYKQALKDLMEMIGGSIQQGRRAIRDLALRRANRSE